MTTDRRFTRRRTGSADLIVGAAIGSGITARAATRGGADFLVALNSARMRMMGAPSSVAKLPLRDNNALVSSFAREEILPQIRIPVFFGAAAYDPRSPISALITSVNDWGFAGIANARSVAHYYGPLRDAIEKAGLGITRECEMFARAKAAGLATLAFVRTVQDAEAFAVVGVDMFCIQLAWNAGEFGEGVGAAEFDRAMEVARSIISRIRPSRSPLPCLVSGAPIVEPEQMLAFCDFARADGYIAGSSVDRLPSEGSVENRMADFKNVALLRRSRKEDERRIRNVNRRFGIVAESPAMRAISDRIDLVARSRSPVLITGEAGTGKSTLARSLHEHRSRPTATLRCEAEPRASAIRLFGCLADALPGVAKRRIGWLETLSGSSLVIDGVDSLDRDLQMRLTDAIETGRFVAIGGSVPQPFNVRLIFTSRHSSAELLRSGLIEEALYLSIKPYEFALPPLRERHQDLALLAKQVINMLGSSGRRPVTGLDHSALRVLSAHAWPGNLRELTSTLEEAILHCRSDSVTGREVSMVLRACENRSMAPRAVDQREWILNALRRHRYRRGETALYLGISRKTLYLKMRKLGIEVGR